MNAFEINIVLGFWALLATMGCAALIWLKLRSEGQFKAQLAEAGTRVTQFPRLESQIEELKRSSAGLERQVEAAKIKDSERENSIRTLSSQLTKAEADLENAQVNAQALIETERAALQQLIQTKNDQIREMQAFAARAQEDLKTIFANTANESLAQVVKQLEDQSASSFKLREQKLNDVVDPLKERLDGVLKRCETSDQEITKAKEAFEVQIRQLGSTTNGLVNALKRPNVRGDWGEMALQDALHSAGLEEGLHYSVEHTTDADDERRRADVVIKLPKGEKLVIDSKAPFATYDDAVNGESSDKKALLAKHARALKGHIDTLAGKEYHARYQGPDFVIMFLPHEGMLLAALDSDERLIAYAADKKVFIATPITLTLALGTVGHLIRVDQLNQNAEEIKKTGQDLYASIATFADHYAQVGRGLGSALKAFNSSVGTMESSLIKKAVRLKELGLVGRDLPDVPTLEIAPRSLTKPELTANLDGAIAI